MSELRGIGRRVACAVLVISAVWSAPLAKAQETRFDPEKHLPGRSLLWVDIAQVRVLESDFEETLIGRILMHPGWRRAYSPWSERIGPLLSPIDSVLESWIGRGTHDLLGLFPGGVTLSLVSIHPAGIPGSSSPSKRATGQRNGSRSSIICETATARRQEAMSTRWRSVVNPSASGGWIASRSSRPLSARVSFSRRLRT